MKTKKIMIALAAVLTLSVSFVIAQANKSSIEKVTFNVNMTCQNCVNKVEKNIAYEKGVKTMDVNLEAKTVTLTYDSKKTDKVKLQEALKKLGFVVSETSVKGEKACCSKTSACSDKKEGASCESEVVASSDAKKVPACCQTSAK